MRAYVYSDAIHQRLIDVRKALKKTQKQMAEEMGFSSSVYSKLEILPTAFIKEYIILAVCNTFGVSFDYLVYGEGSMFNDEAVRNKAMQKMFSELPNAWKDHVIGYLEYLTTKAQAMKGRTKNS